MDKLVIFPTSLALRQWQKRKAEKAGFVDSRNYLSNAQFLGECAVAAQSAGLLLDDNGNPLRPADDLDKELAIVEAAAIHKRESDETQILGRLSETALEEVLSRMTGYVDPLADRASEFLDLLAADTSTPSKKRELGVLYRRYDEILAGRGKATVARVNAAILQLLCGDKDQWPASLKSAKQIVFNGLRWVPPFVELVVRALEAKLGKKNVVLEHILQEYEQEWWGKDLLTCAGIQIFGGTEDPAAWQDHNSEQTTASINQLLDLRDGLAMEDSALAQPAWDRVEFSQSVGVYGEVEDMARRIVYAIRGADKKERIRAQDICFTTRSIGNYSDAIVDVFKRFGIPYYFRRGFPVMSIAVVKAILGLVHLSVSREREEFCTLLESPWLEWRSVLQKDEEWIVEPGELADDIRRSGVEPQVTRDHLRQRLTAWYAERGRVRNVQERVDAAVGAFGLAVGNVKATGIKAAIHDVLDRCDKFRIRELLQDWADKSEDAVGDNAYVLNARAYGAVRDVLEALENQDLGSMGDQLRWHEVSSVISRATRNLTVTDPVSNDAGVWILNPYDAAGLHFKMVLVAGLNSGEFPVVPSQNAVFGDAELESLRERMGDSLPKASLAGSQARNSQENLLFLSIMAAAGECMVFSRTSRNDAGEEVPASVFYNTLWRLAGWPAYGPADGFPAGPLGSYDRWRVIEVPDVYGEHWTRQKNADPHKRTPFCGESFFAVIPPALCCAPDEARQAAAAGKKFESVEREVDVPTVSHVVECGLEIEHVRDAYFDALAVDGEDDGVDLSSDERRYVGCVDESLWETLNPSPAGEIMDFGTTALQTLATCPYRYYLSRILGLEEARTNELEAQPIDYGTVVHLVMETGLRLLRGDDPWSGCVRGLKALKKKYGELCVPAWYLQDGAKLVYKGRSKTPLKDGTAVVEMEKARASEYEAFFAALCEVYEDAFQKGDYPWMLGAPELADIEWRKLRHAVLNVVSGELGVDDALYSAMLTDTERAAVSGEGLTRCTVLLEHMFDGRSPRHPNAPSVEFTESGEGGRRLRVHGKVDRVDLLFDQGGDQGLRAILVLDYKGSPSAYDRTADKHAESIVSGQDCQLPVYGESARKYFAANGVAAPVICMYISYKQDSEAQRKALKNKHWIRLDGKNLKDETLEALSEAGGSLMDVFVKKLFTCLDVLENGTFFVKSTDCRYCDFSGICRYSENQLGVGDDDS